MKKRLLVSLLLLSSCASKTPCVERLDIPLSECLSKHHSKPIINEGVLFHCDFGKKVYIPAGVRVPEDPCGDWRR